MTRMIAPAAIRKSIAVKASIDQAFKTFTAGMGRWWPASHSIGGSPLQDVVMEPKVGGKFRMSFRNFTTGESHVFGGEHVDLVPGERLRYTDRFDDPNLPGEMQVTVTLKKV